MTTRPLPQLGRAILDRVADRNEPLAGDIVEGYQFNQSRLWFWRELLGAIFRGSFRRMEIRPLKLVEFPSFVPPREDFAAKRLWLQARLGASPVDGVGGLTMVAVIMLISVLQPVLWAMLALGAGTGVAIGIARAAYHRRHMSEPGADLTTIALSEHHFRT